MDASTKKMDRAKAASKGLAGKLGGIGGGALHAAGAVGAAAGVAGIAGQVINTADPINGMDAAKLDNASGAGSNAAIDEQMRNADWANGNEGFWGRLNHGTLSGINNAGDAANYLTSMGGGRKFTEGVNAAFGVNTAASQAKADFAAWDAKLAQLVQSGDTVTAGNQFNQLVFQAEAKGSTQEDVMGLFPQYKQAVYEKLGSGGRQVDDAMALQAMRSDRGSGAAGTRATVPWAPRRVWSTARSTCSMRRRRPGSGWTTCGRCTTARQCRTPRPHISPPRSTSPLAPGPTARRSALTSIRRCGKRNAVNGTRTEQGRRWVHADASCERGAHVVGEEHVGGVHGYSGGREPPGVHPVHDTPCWGVRGAGR